MYVFAYLWCMEKDTELRKAYALGGLAAVMHMLEIVPLVILLSGLVARPFIPICVLVAFTTPITFYLYNAFAKQWCGPAAAASEAKPAITRHHAAALLVVGITLGLSTILGPLVLIPPCTPDAAGMGGVAASSPAVSLAQNATAGLPGGSFACLSNLTAATPIVSAC